MSGPARITILSATVPTRLTKYFSLHNDALQVTPGGALVEADVRVVEIDTLDDLATLLPTLRPSEAATYGVPALPGATRVYSRERFRELGRPDGACSRTKTDFRWPSGAGVMMLDYDPPRDGSAMGRDELIAAVRQAAPGLAHAAMLWWPSAGSNIVHDSDGRKFTPLRGQRLWLLVEDAADIPRAGRTLCDRLWLNGHGRIDVSRSGALLERTPLDSAVWSPERLDFSAGPACGPGLRQARGPVHRASGTVEFVDTRACIPSLTPAETAEVTRLKDAAKRDAAPKVALIRAEYIDRRAEEIAEPEADETALANAREVVEAALDGGTLFGDFLVEVEENGQIVPRRVREILDSPQTYHGRLCRDPIEPGYHGGRLVAKLHCDGVPNIFSFARGGRTFRLRRNRAQIEVPRGGLAEAAQKTVEHLAAAPDIFVKNGALVQVDAGRLHPLDGPTLENYCGLNFRYVRPRKLRDGASTAEPMDPPKNLIDQVAAIAGRSSVRRVVGQHSGPLLRDDGTVAAVPGFDAQTQWLLSFDAEETPPIPATPTLADATEAAERLLAPFALFPFTSDTDRAVLLAALLSAALRPTLPTCPAVAFDAPVQSSGKTLLAQSIGALADRDGAQLFCNMSGVHKEEELRKRLLSILCTDTRAAIIDNLIGQFDSAAIAAMLTSPTYTDRPLGATKTLTVQNRVLLLLTGNNLWLAGDLPRRVLTCRIEPKTDRPETRKFDFCPLAWVKAKRLEMTVDALTVVRAWLQGGDGQRAPGSTASFELWDERVRQPVAWLARCAPQLGVADPADALAASTGADPDRAALSDLLTAWHRHFGEAWQTASQVQKVVGDAFSEGPARELSEALGEIAGVPALRSTKSLGRVLNNRRGRQVGPLVVETREDKSKGCPVYRVVDVDFTERPKLAAVA